MAVTAQTAPPGSFISSQNSTIGVTPHRRQRLIEHFVQMAELQLNSVEVPEPFIGGIVLRTSAMIDLRSYHKSFAGMDQGVTRLITLAYYDDLGIR